MTTTTSLFPGSRVHIRAAGHWYDGHTGMIASLNVHEDGETPLHRVAVGGKFVAVPVGCLVPLPPVDTSAPIWPKPRRRA